MTKQTTIVSNEAARERVIALLSVLNIDKPWKVTVERHAKTRTLSQNALMWRWLNEVEGLVRDYTGHNSDEIHEFLKHKFLPARMIEINGETVEYRSTKNLTTGEMADYMNQIYAWAGSELGLILPIPEELGR